MQTALLFGYLYMLFTISFYWLKELKGKRKFLHAQEAFWLYDHYTKSHRSPSPTPQFKSINSLGLSFLYTPTLTSIRDYWKNNSLDKTDLCWQSNVCFLICCLGWSYGEGNGTPLQYSCLENSMDGGAW